jgi:hypothetical protein
LAALIACHPAPGRLAPVGLEPVSTEQVDQWVHATIPPDPWLLRFKWLFRDERSSAGGRGSARIAPPDSLRFDVSGPFGSNATAAAVTGDTAVWTEPEDAIKKLVPNYPLLWAMLGIARPPQSGERLEGLSDDHTLAWRYVQDGDTVEYVRTSNSPVRLRAEVRNGSKVVGRVETELDANGFPRTARLTVPSVPARLDLTFTSTSRTEPFAPSIWAPPQH